jgi:hypothetical protein
MSGIVGRQGNNTGVVGQISEAMMRGEVFGKPAYRGNYISWGNFSDHTNVAHTTPWTFTLFKGPTGTDYHLFMSWQVSSPSSGLNYSVGRTGFDHNGGNLYEYGRDENHGAHFSAPNWLHTNATGVTQAQFYNQGGSTMTQDIVMSYVIVSNVELIPVHQ